MLKMLTRLRCFLFPKIGNKKQQSRMPVREAGILVRLPCLIKMIQKKPILFRMGFFCWGLLNLHSGFMLPARQLPGYRIGIRFSF